MRRFAYAVVVLSLLLAACGTSAGDPASTTTTTAVSTTSTTMEMTDGTNDGHGDGHDGHEHEEVTREVDAASAPEVSNLRVTEVASGWMVEFDVTGHEFSQAAKDGPHVDGQGHAHLYVNGTKLATIFGPVYLIDELPEGEHTISVTLNSNDHATLTRNGEPIGAMAMVTVEAGVSPTATVTIENGEPSDGIVRVEVTAGDTVILEVISDTTDEVHVHGLDIYGAAVAGEPLLMTFEATLAGIWEIELEGTHTQIAELVVNP